MTGFFEMADVNVVVNLTIDHAKKYALQKIEDFKQQHPAVQKSNVVKVERIIQKANCPKKLAIDISNFILAHPSENLKVIK